MVSSKTEDSASSRPPFVRSVDVIPLQRHKERKEAASSTIQPTLGCQRSDASSSSSPFINRRTISLDEEDDDDDYRNKDNNNSDNENEMFPPPISPMSPPRGFGAAPERWTLHTTATTLTSPTTSSAFGENNTTCPLSPPTSLLVPSLSTTSPRMNSQRLTFTYRNIPTNNNAPFNNTTATATFSPSLFVPQSPASPRGINALYQDDEEEEEEEPLILSPPQVSRRLLPYRPRCRRFLPFRDWGDDGEDDKLVVSGRKRKERD